jgi:galactarate dehydratase (D-threo-forming)
MHITEIRVYPVVRVRRRYPTVISMQIGADGVSPVEESCFVLFEVVTDEGIRGIGEVSDIPEDRLPDLPPLKAELERCLLNRDPFELAGILDALDAQPEENRTVSTRLYHCAVDMALYDIQGKAAHVPVYCLLGGRRRDSIPISAVLFIRDPELIAEEAKERFAQGFRHFKLKVGLGLEHDEASLAALREAVGPEPSIKIDPNGAWTVEEAIQSLRRLERYGISGVETPIAARDIEGKLALKREIQVPILEHVSDPAFALECVKRGAVDVFNIALCGCGGILRARQVAAVAEAAGIPCLLGSTLELWPGTAAQAHFGATIRLGYPSDLVGPLMYQDDVVADPWSYCDGGLPVQDADGLGISLDYSRLGAPI